jgi:hypothetical protein
VTPAATVAWIEGELTLLELNARELRIGSGLFFGICSGRSSSSFKKL